MVGHNEPVGSVRQRGACVGRALDALDQDRPRPVLAQRREVGPRAVRARVHDVEPRAALPDRARVPEQQKDRPEPVRAQQLAQRLLEPREERPARRAPLRGQVFPREDGVGEAVRAALAPDEGQVGAVEVRRPPAEREGICSNNKRGIFRSTGAREEGCGDVVVLRFRPVQLQRHILFRKRGANKRKDAAHLEPTLASTISGGDLLD